MATISIHTRTIVKAHGFRSLILVTSWNRMPRSHLLLKAMRIGSNIDIYMHTVHTGNRVFSISGQSN
jgi:hypothetical protein